jgi:hypothetical protein
LAGRGKKDGGGLRGDKGVIGGLSFFFRQEPNLLEYAKTLTSDYQHVEFDVWV